MRRFVQAFSGGEGWPADMDPTLAAALSAVADRYNIAVRKPASVIVQGEAGPAALEAIWGLVPRWSPEPATKYTTVTARLERAARSRIFANAWQHRHCVVPMSGYYKWDRSVSPPVPNFIQSTRGDILLVAGLWETWEKGDVPLHTFTILTHPNDAIPAPLVPDGPVFLPQAQWRSWLAGAPRLSARVLSRLEQPMLEAYPVSRAVRDPDRDDYTLLEPASTSTSAEDPVFSLDDDLDGFDDVDDVDDES